MDSTQLFLLNGIIILSIVLIMFSFITLVSSIIFYLLNNDKNYLLHIPHLSIFFIISIVLLFFARLMTFVSDGI